MGESIIVKRLDEKSDGYFVVEADGKKYDYLKINLSDGTNLCIEFLEKNKFNIYSITSKKVKFTPANANRPEFNLEIES